MLEHDEIKKATSEIMKLRPVRQKDDKPKINGHRTRRQIEDIQDQKILKDLIGEQFEKQP